MAALGTHVTFSRAASVSVHPDDHAAKMVALPPIDPDNLALMIENKSGVTCWMQIGNIPSGMPAGPDVVGCMIVHSGKTVLLTVGTQGTATHAAVRAQMAGHGPVLFTRGAADSIEKFTRDDAIRV
jgi:hypothetical protein